MKRYPVIFLALCFVVGILTDHFFHPALPVSTAIITAAGFSLASLVLRRFSQPATWLVGCAVVFSALATSRQFQKNLQFNHLGNYPNFAQITVAGRLASEVSLKNERFRFDFAIQAVKLDSQWRREKGLVRVTSRMFPTNYQPFCKLILHGNWVQPKAPAYPGGFDYRRYLDSRKIGGLIKLRKDGAIVVELDNESGGVNRMLAHARAKLWHIIQIVTDAETAPILRGLFIGDRDMIDPQIIDVFSQIGIIHVLAISGLHVGFIVLLAYILAAIFRLPRLPRDCFAMLVVWAFAMFAGLKTPVFRAAIMFSVFTFARLRDRSMDGFSLLALSALIVLAINPRELFAVGFQLSFSAVAGILYFYAKLEKLFRSCKFGEFLWQFEAVAAILKCLPLTSGFGGLLAKTGLRFHLLRYFPALFLVTLSAQLGTAPFIFFHFGRFSFISFIANLIVIPGIFLMIIIAVPTFILYSFSPFAAAYVGNAIDAIMHFILNTSIFFASIHGLSIVDFYPHPFYIVVTLLFIICLLEWQKAGLRFVLLFAAFASLNWQIWSQNFSKDDRNIKITVLDIGQGDATAIIFPGKKIMLIDAGPASHRYDAGEKVILPFLRKAGIEQIDMAVISHPHMDHYGGFGFLARKIPVHCAVFADTSYLDKAFRGLVKRMAANGTEIKIVRRGDILEEFAPAIFYVLGPHPAMAKIKRNWNQASLVLKLQYGKCSMLFGGDTELAGEDELLQFGDFLISDLLKTGHHGSRTSSGLPFLQQVRPEWVTISAGAFNKFNHPATEIIERYSQRSIRMARTDFEGALQFATDGLRLWRIVN